MLIEIHLIFFFYSKLYRLLIICVYNSLNYVSLSSLMKSLVMMKWEVLVSFWFLQGFGMLSFGAFWIIIFLAVLDLHWDTQGTQAIHCGVCYLPQVGSAIAAHRLSCDMWDLVPWPGIEPRPLHWEHRVLSTRPPGQSQGSLIWNKIMLEWAINI